MSKAILLVNLGSPDSPSVPDVRPAFVADCLETIEEIGLRGCEQFMAGNGQEFTRIPCLNEHPAWITALEKMTRKFLAAKS